MEKITTIAIDLAKHVFEVAGEDLQGKVLQTQRMKSREAFYAYIQRLQPPLLVGLEVGLGAQAWARVLQERGLEVRLLPAQLVATHRSGGKNDRNDARAILRALRDEKIHPVPVKTVAQLSMQALHRARAGWVRRKTALSNQMRGLLLEHGVVFGRGDKRLMDLVPRVLEDASIPVPDLLRGLLEVLWLDWQGQVQRLEAIERQFVTLMRQDPLARRLETIPGIGPITATALACKGIDVSQFRNSRQFAAYFGIVPDQHSTGEKVRLGRMTRRGDRYIRSLTVNGAHAVIRCIRKDDQRPEARRLRRWRDRHGNKGAAVRLANRNLRIVWALLRTEADYRRAGSRPSSPRQPNQAN